MLVYFAAPYLALLAVGWLPVPLPEWFRLGVSLVGAIGAYALLRRVFGDRMPHL